MHRLTFLLACFLMLSGGAEAQTTTWNPSDKDAAITLSSGNLTATGASSPSNVFKAVRATVGKWNSGKWCYQFTPQTTLDAFSIGLAAADYPLNGFAYLGTTNQTESHALAGMNAQGGVWFADIQTGTNDPSLAVGTIGEVCADMGAKPPLMWITPNVSGTGGPGGGPKWNGDATANPVGDVNGALIFLYPAQQAQALNSCCAFPIFISRNGDSVTANFGSFTPPTGYSTWNTVGGDVPSAPNPWTPLKVNVANAPAWQASHVYHAGAAIATVTTPVASPGVVNWTGHGLTAGQAVSFSEQSGIAATFPTGIIPGTVYYVISAGLTTNAFEIAATPGGSAINFTGSSSGTQHGFALRDRVVAGPAWSGSAYTNGLDLCLWAVIAGGTSGSSASAFNTACSTGTPAAVGGGLYGVSPAGWFGATTVTEGGVSYVLLSKIDYVTVTAALEEDPMTWTQSTNYGYKQYIVNTNVGNNGSIFRLSGFDSPNSNDPQCTSAATGTGPTSSVGTDGTPGVGFGQCTWDYQGDIIYSSGTHKFQHWIKNFVQQFPDVPTQIYADIAFYYDTIYNFWYGGAQRVRYQGGQNNENDPPYLRNHSGSDDEGGAGGFAGTGGLFPVEICRNGSVCGGSNGNLNWNLFRVFLQAAPGDSFRDNIRPGVDPLRYDETKGVSFYSNTAYVDLDWTQVGSPLSVLDQAVIYNGLELKSENSFAAAHNTNHLFIMNSILDGGGAGAVGTIDSTTVGQVLDSLVIARGQFALFGKYGVGITGSTIICDPTVSNSMGVIRHIGGGLGSFPWSNQQGGPPFYNNLILGCKIDNAVANNTFGPIPSPYGWTIPFYSGGNATDIVDPTISTIVPAFAGYPSSNARTYGSLTFGGYNNTCGPSNTSPCTGLTASAVVVNPTIGPTLDATLKSNSPVKGAGVNFSFPMVPGDPTGHWWGYYSFLNGGASTPFLTPPATDILRTARP